MSHQAVKEKYNKDIRLKFGSDYEKNRWFKDDFSRSGYDAMFASIRRYAVPGDFKNCLELGPGHGTWTNVFLDSYPEANYDLVDISSEMLDLVKSRFSRQKNIRYFETDFLDFSNDKVYDFFFSSRVIEYIVDKELLIKKIYSVLGAGARGFIITKTPKYLRLKLMGKKVSEFHSHQIEARMLVELLQKAGFTNIEVRPITFVWPLWRSASMNRMLYKLFGEKKLNSLSQFFSESYSVSFKKI